MSKNKKRKKSKEKDLENNTEKSFEQQAEKNGENELKKQLKAAVEGLYYISETDAEILPFTGKQSQSVTGSEILTQTESQESTPIEERIFAEFFARLTEIQDWFGDEEKATAQQFADLKNLLENNLRDLKVFKLGKVQIDIYVVGLDSENNLLGIKTKAVET